MGDASPAICPCGALNSPCWNLFLFSLLCQGHCLLCYWEQNKKTTQQLALPWYGVRVHVSQILLDTTLLLVNIISDCLIQWAVLRKNLKYCRCEFQYQMCVRLPGWRFQCLFVGKCWVGIGCSSLLRAPLYF